MKKVTASAGTDLQKCWHGSAKVLEKGDVTYTAAAAAITAGVHENC